MSDHKITGPDGDGDYFIDGSMDRMASVFHPEDMEPAEALRLLAEHLRAEDAS